MEAGVAAMRAQERPAPAGPPAAARMPATAVPAARAPVARAPVARAPVARVAGPAFALMATGSVIALAACSAAGPAAGTPGRTAQASSAAPAAPAGSAAQAAPAASRATPASDAPGAPGALRAPSAGRPGIGVLGRFWTGRRRLTFTEPARTGPTGERLGPRRLLIQLRYPLSGRPPASTRPAPGPLPLIVFGPGYRQCGGPYSGLLRAWASAGYLVAVVNFPRSDCLTGAAATESDLVKPADMSYAITRMLRLSATGRGLLGGLVRPREIAIAGQSDGGDTVAAIAANTCCTDRRVAAVAVLSGAEWPAMPGHYFTGRPVPVLFAQGSADPVNLPGCSVAMYLAGPARARYYLNLLGADHTGPYWGSNRFERVVARVTLAFFDRYVLGQAAAGAAMRRYGNVAHVAALYGHGRGRLAPGPCVT